MATSIRDRQRIAEWQRQNPDRTREHRRKYREQQRKPCKTCGVALPFPSPGRMYCSKTCQPNHSRLSRQRRLARLAVYKCGRGCDRCGYNKCARALDFHHRRPEEKAHRVWNPFGPEYEKCDLLCANCHREAHAEGE